MRKSVQISLALLIAALVFSFQYGVREPFVGSQDDPRCGLGLPPCPVGRQCGNGFCIKTQPPALPPNTGLPVYP